MNIENIRVLNRENPLGIGGALYFSWELASSQENTVQLWYVLRVTESATGREVWNTGRRESSQNAYVPYAGEALSSCTRYSWTVQAGDNHGDTAAATGSFETAYLTEAEWTAAWAVGECPAQPRGKGFGKSAPATLFRKAFSVNGDVTAARLYATCRGIYQLTVNGQAPDGRRLAPEYTSYPSLLCYQTYDVTGLLRAGENVLGMQVADGWYMGPATAMCGEDAAAAHAVLFELALTYADGSRDLITSSDGVRWAHGAVVSADLFAGELYDARRELPGWDAPGFDDSAWQAAARGDCSKANLCAQTGEPVVTAYQLPVRQLYTSPKGETILDFGQNFAGTVRMHVDAPKDTEVTLDLFEVTDKEGNYCNTILETSGIGEGADQRIRFISNGTPATYEPQFTFAGFRYARVSGLSAVRGEDFTGIALSTKKEDLGTFTCSNEQLNRLYANIRWSQLSNMLSIPSDCPQREKAGWTGDIGLYAKTALLNEDVTGLLARWLQSLSADQLPDGAVPIVSPYNTLYHAIADMMGQRGGNSGPMISAGWGDAAVLVPYAMYEGTGNTEILKQQFGSMQRWCDYIIQAAKRRGDEHIPAAEEQYLWNTGVHYGEWLIPSTSAGGVGGEGVGIAMMVSAKYTAPLYGWRSVRLFANICDVLGRAEEAKTYGAAADHMKRVIQKYLVLQDGQIPWPYMGAYVLMLAFGMAEGEARQLYVDRLVAAIHENGDCMDTGFLATPFLLDVLSDNGHQDLAYRLLFQTKSPSWLYEVANGATTIWESCLGYGEDGNPLPISMNHYSFGAVADWVFRNVNGIRPEAPGFTRVTIAPQPTAYLTSARRSFHTPQGELSTDWQTADGQFSLRVTIPCNTQATVVLPDGARYEVGSGAYRYTCSLT